jgi:hypothetical protein
MDAIKSQIIKMCCASSKSGEERKVKSCASSKSGEEGKVKSCRNKIKT